MLLTRFAPLYPFDLPRKTDHASQYSTYSNDATLYLSPKYAVCVATSVRRNAVVAFSGVAPGLHRTANTFRSSYDKALHIGHHDNTSIFLTDSERRFLHRNFVRLASCRLGTNDPETSKRYKFNRISLEPTQTQRQRRGNIQACASSI